MSFILDALKKSEAERRRQAGPALLEMRIVRPQRRLPLWVVAVCVALVACILLLGWLAWRAGNAAAGAAAGAATGAAAPAPLPTASPAAAPVAAVPAVGAYAPAAAPATRADPAPQRAPPAAAPASVPTASDADSDEADAARNPADQEPAVTAPAARADGSSANLHSYAELSGRLPQMRLDLHVYAAVPADRYAFINMRKVREGDVTPEGVRVLEITRDGVVLDYQGTEFLLGRQ